MAKLFHPCGGNKAVCMDPLVPPAPPPGICCEHSLLQVWNSSAHSHTMQCSLRWKAGRNPDVHQYEGWLINYGVCSVGSVSQTIFPAVWILFNCHTVLLATPQSWNAYYSLVMLPLKETSPTYHVHLHWEGVTSDIHFHARRQPFQLGIWLIVTVKIMPIMTGCDSAHL